MSTATILRADARALPLPDASVDLIVTSPPYYGLRSYTDGGEHYAGQIGAESTPAEYVANLIDCTREWMRVLKSTGSLWVNLGDKYATRYSSRRGAGRSGLNNDDDTRARSGQNRTGVPEKSLIGLPWRYALRCIDDLGLTLRAEVVWSKPNGLPESVTDRVRRSHEQWFHFTKSPRYFAAVDEIRQPHSSKPTDKGANCLAGQRSLRPVGPNSGAYNPLGALPGSVWEIATEPLTVPDHLGVDHFAAFPTEWPRRIILGWSPSGICTDCGEGRRPVTAAAADPQMKPFRIAQAGTRQMGGVASSSLGHSAAAHQRAITGEACACPDTSAPTRPAVVLDPFSGTGTTPMVAKALGRTGIGVEMSADYCRLATWRTNDPGQIAKAMRVEKPPVQTDGQADLFADLFGGAA